MLNAKQKGDVIDATAPYARTAGQGALIGSMFGVAANDVANAAVGEFVVEEAIVALTRETGAGSAPTEGALAYWDDTNKRVTKTSTSNTKIGVFVYPVPLDADLTALVRLNGAF